MSDRGTRYDRIAGSSDWPSPCGVALLIAGDSWACGEPDDHLGKHEFRFLDVTLSWSACKSIDRAPSPERPTDALTTSAPVPEIGGERCCQSDSGVARALVCRLLGHRWNYCCRFAYQAGHLWCQRCRAINQSGSSSNQTRSAEDFR